MTENKNARHIKDILFQSLDRVRDKDVDLEELRTIVTISNSICNTVRTEIKLAKFNAGKCKDDKIEF